MAGGLDVELLPGGGTILKGSVFSERYMPASGKFDSRYSFSMDTIIGRLVIQVESTDTINKESIDALIEPGTEVKVEFNKNQRGLRIYTISAYYIKLSE